MCFGEWLDGSPRPETAMGMSVAGCTVHRPGRERRCLGLHGGLCCGGPFGALDGGVPGGLEGC